MEEGSKEVNRESLGKFIDHVMNDYKHNYSSIVYAIGSCAVATANACNSMEQGGITGFQASFVMWEFIHQWSKPSNVCGLRLIDMDDMLYPQYECKFAKTISKSTFERLQNEAEKQLKEHIVEGTSVHPDVLLHWNKIKNGEVPFGYRISED